MNNQRIFVLGYFGYVTDQLDGQTIKTRNIYSTLKKHIQSLHYFDTQRLQRNPLSGFRIIHESILCNTIILLPAQNNLTYIFPILYLLSRLFGFKIIHLGIGGWLADYCRKHPCITKMLKADKIILLENSDVVERLREEQQMTNVGLLHNYRITDFEPQFTQSNEERPLRIVFMARINKMKGLDVMFNIARHYKNSGNVQIDFYGPIFEPDRDYFEENVAKYDFVNYKGSLAPQNINVTLNTYDIMLFPTRYYTEGFPGSVLDAYISGIPVVASNWKYAHEFIVEGFNGFICEVDNTKSFIEKIDTFISNRDLLLQMKHNAHTSSLKYSETAAWEILKRYL